MIILDQAEEVFSLRPEMNDLVRNGFFQFMTLMSHALMDIKIIVSLRTEFFGRFAYSLDSFGAEQRRMSHLWLGPLSRKNLVAAILRPTVEDSIADPTQPDGGVPRRKYLFKYEEGAAERIAADLIRDAPEGGILPVMQIACTALVAAASKASGDPVRVITERQFKSIGHVGLLLERYIDEALMAKCRREFATIVRSVKEAFRWKRVLAKLCRSHADGSITTRIRTREEVSEAARLAGCELPFEDMITWLTQPRYRVCRELTLLSGDSQVTAYALGHDVLGLALVRWQYSERTMSSSISVLKYVSASLAVAILSAVWLLSRIVEGPWLPLLAGAVATLVPVAMLSLFDLQELTRLGGGFRRRVVEPFLRFFGDGAGLTGTQFESITETDANEVSRVVRRYKGFRSREPPIVVPVGLLYDLPVAEGPPVLLRDIQVTPLDSTSSSVRLEPKPSEGQEYIGEVQFERRTNGPVSFEMSYTVERSLSKNLSIHRRRWPDEPTSDHVDWISGARWKRVVIEMRWDDTFSGTDPTLTFEGPARPATVIREEVKATKWRWELANVREDLKVIIRWQFRDT